MLLRGGRLVDPASGRDGIADLRITEGKIAEIGTDLKAKDKEDVLDLTGKVVCPGFLDMHVHLREPGQEWKETVETGTRAAAAGGFTGVACMPNTHPVNDNRSVTELIVAQARLRGAVAVHPVGCVSKGQEGKELAEMGDMVDAGAVAFSDDGKPVATAQMMRRALEYSKIFGVPIIDHCEEPTLVDGGVVHEGPISMRMGLKGWPGVAEDVMVMRDILLAEYTGGHVHIAHMSTGRSALFVREGKKRGIHVTCEVTPHHFLLTHEAVVGYDTDAKMNPPLRTEQDRDRLLQALVDGTVDAIATDHAPHHADEKCVEFSMAPFGVVGLETAVSLCLDRLVHANVLPLSRMVALFTTGPAGVLGLDKGTLAPGKDADVTVLDLERTVTVEPKEFKSKSQNTPFKGLTLKGTPILTVVGGKVIHDAR